MLQPTPLWLRVSAGHLTPLREVRWLRPLAILFWVSGITSSPSVPGPNHLRLQTVPEKMHLVVKRPERQADQSYSSTATINLLYACKRHDAVTNIS